MSSLFGLTVEQAAARIGAREPLIHAFVSTRLPEARRATPAPGPLRGVPYSLKDEWETLALPTTGGSWRHRDRRSREDSRVARAFDGAGAVLVGKTNLSDMGLAPEATSWVGGATRNPHDLTRTAGGSSGGAAAAVADGMVGFDWGTDIGGSIRLPAANCGIWGLRLSSETWPVTELFPTAPPGLAWMLGQGPMTRDLAQMRALLDVAEPRLKTGTARAGWRPTEAVLLTVARGGHWPGFVDEVAPPLRRVLGGAAPDGLPATSRARWLYSAVWCSHFDDLLTVEPDLDLRRGLSAVISAVVTRGRLGDRRIHPITADVLLQVAAGALLWRDKEKVLAGVRAYRDAFERVWDRGAVVVMPVCAWPAARIGRTSLNPRILECTMPGNLLDATALAMPWGRFSDGLPRAIQLMGPPGSERELIALAEKLTPPSRS